ncbi:hypothetical protein [Peterkaempfera bronchialis]|uniref:hypothetical protein n=1 Tax=Peterkaempfera bronchialis TaxID=2126346 RepID=UPI003C2F7455
MTGSGLDDHGFIAREGSLGLVPEEFAAVVDAARTRIAAAFGPARLHSAYLYGSIPRGTAVPGVSDLDLLLALRHRPGAADRADARALEASLDADFPQVDGVGVLLHDRATLLSDLERYDLGWFLACLCTPLLGDDLAARLPRYGPTSLLARETNGDLALLLPRWRTQAAAARTAPERRALCRRVARRIVRTGTPQRRARRCPDDHRRPAGGRHPGLPGDDRRRPVGLPHGCERLRGTGGGRAAAGPRHGGGAVQYGDPPLCPPAARGAGSARDCRTGALGQLRDAAQRAGEP